MTESHGIGVVLRDLQPAPANFAPSRSSVDLEPVAVPKAETAQRC